MDSDKEALLCSLPKKQNCIHCVSWICDYILTLEDNGTWGLYSKGHSRIPYLSSCSQEEKYVIYYHFPSLKLLLCYKSLWPNHFAIDNVLLESFFATSGKRRKNKSKKEKNLRLFWTVKMFNGNIRELLELRCMNLVMPAVMCQYQLSVPLGRISRISRISSAK